MRLLTWAVLCAAALLGASPAARAQRTVDVALVLAVDVSSSVDDDRFKLQREGIAAALDSDDFAAVVSGGASQTIEIAVLEWAEEQRVVVPWTVVHGRADLAELALRLRRSERVWLHPKTDPAGGIAAADRLFASMPRSAARQVIDVSGDGRQNTGEISTIESRDAAVARGATVNGLPIVLGDDPNVDGWYRDNVIGGPGAFLIVANGYEAFADAFRQKVTLEIAGLVPPQRFATARLPSLAR
jgi:hypothetical protein